MHISNHDRLVSRTYRQLTPQLHSDHSQPSNSSSISSLTSKARKTGGDAVDIITQQRSLEMDLSLSGKQGICIDLSLTLCRVLETPIWIEMMSMVCGKNLFIGHAITAINALSNGGIPALTSSLSSILPKSSPSKPASTPASSNTGSRPQYQLPRSALKQYDLFLEGSRFSLSTSPNISVADPHQSRLASIVCLLTICLESLQFHHDQALRQIGMGLKLVDEWTYEDVDEEKLTERSESTTKYAGEQATDSTKSLFSDGKDRTKQTERCKQYDQEQAKVFQMLRAKVNIMEGGLGSQQLWMDPFAEGDGYGEEHDDTLGMSWDGKPRNELTTDTQPGSMAGNVQRTASAPSHLYFNGETQNFSQTPENYAESTSPPAQLTSTGLFG